MKPPAKPGQKNQKPKPNQKPNQRSHLLKAHITNPMIMTVDSTFSRTVKFAFILTDLSDSININWGDGTNNTFNYISPAGQTHIYTTSAVFTVNVVGKASGLGAPNSNLLALTGIVSWGDLGTGFRSLQCACLSATNLTAVPNYIPSSVKYLDNMFNSATRINDPNISKWNVFNVYSMQGLFMNASVFNQPLWRWNVANVSNMSSMFQAAFLFNRPIWNWNVQLVGDMSYMFRYAYKFRRILYLWKPYNVVRATQMFCNCPLMKPALYPKFVNPALKNVVLCPPI